MTALLVDSFCIAPYHRHKYIRGYMQRQDKLKHRKPLIASPPGASARGGARTHITPSLSNRTSMSFTLSSACTSGQLTDTRPSRPEKTLPLIIMIPNEQHIELQESLVLSVTNTGVCEGNFAIKPDSRVRFEYDLDRLEREPSELIR
jgi:hypothetical protein